MNQLHLQTELVAIDRIDIRYNQTPEYFGYTERQIERGAKLVLDAKGIIIPLILKRANNVYNGVVVEDATPDGRYEIVSGFLRYYCAVRAKEINPLQEFVQAIIIDNSFEENLIKQIEFFGVRETEPEDFTDEFGDDLDFELDDNQQIISAQLAEFGDLDFELVEDDVEALVDKAMTGNSVESCFDAAQRLCNLYPDKDDRANAIAELEEIRILASGDKTYRSRLDNFFATGEI